MKSIERSEKKNKLKTSLRFDHAVAKRTLIKMLSSIRVGRLVLDDDGDVMHFGQPLADTSLVAHIHVYDQRAYATVLFGGAIGSGEAYMRKHWGSPDLVMVVRLMLANKRYLNNMNSWFSKFSRVLDSFADRFRLNTLAGSRKHIAEHYDLSNDFFKLFLDETMMYSSAIFPSDNASLYEASCYKLDHTCRRLNLSSDDHLLEIGSGWGGMAVHAAKHYGCKVTTTTVSKEQYELACERVKNEGLENQVTVLMQDYRKLEGRFDKIVSIEMIEAVGHEFYATFFSRCNHLLKDDGLMLIQAITTQDQRFEREKNNADFIRKYIFPGGCLPANFVIADMVAKHTDMHIVGLEDITLDYARTLAMWKQRFFDNLDSVHALGFDETFTRMWDFYLSYCEGGFAERVINTSQFLFAKPLCRDMPRVG